MQHVLFELTRRRAWLRSLLLWMLWVANSWTVQLHFCLSVSRSAIFVNTKGLYPRSQAEIRVWLLVNASVSVWFAATVDLLRTTYYKKKIHPILFFVMWDLDFKSVKFLKLKLGVHRFPEQASDTWHSWFLMLNQDDKCLCMLMPWLLCELICHLLCWLPLMMII